VINWFLAGMKTGLIRDPLPFSPFLCIFFFDENLFLAGTKSGLMFLFFSVFSFFGCVLFALFFSGLIALFFWVFLLLSGAVSCSVSGLISLFFWVFLFFFGSGFSSPFYREASPATSPVFAGLCYGIHERDYRQETWSKIRFVADYQLLC
jgi:hypothetical protein